jgi:PAS domain S-box-containing protein
MHMARRNKSRGLCLEDSLRIIEYMRLACYDLLDERPIGEQDARVFTRFIEHCWSRLELGVRLNWQESKEQHESSPGQVDRRLLVAEKGQCLKFIDALPFSIIAVDQDLRFTASNSAFCNLTGYTAQELQGRPFNEIIQADCMREDPAYAAMNPVSSPPPAACRTSLLKKSGSVLPARIVGMNVAEQADARVLGVFAVEDLGQQNELCDRLTKALRENQVLLAEVQHRVRNNLAVLLSLITWHRRYRLSSEADSVLKRLHRRVSSMALTHHAAHDAEDIAEIHASRYLGTLIGRNVEAHETVMSRVQIETRVQALPLDLETAVSLGFIVTELLTNCLEHAFPRDRHGTITVSLHHPELSHYELCIADDGVGTVKDFTFQRDKSVGLELVEVFTEQLRGTLVFESRPQEGTRVVVRFPVNQS